MHKTFTTPISSAPAILLTALLALGTLPVASTDTARTESPAEARIADPTDLLGFGADHALRELGVPDRASAGNSGTIWQFGSDPGLTVTLHSDAVVHVAGTLPDNHTPTGTKDDQPWIGQSVRDLVSRLGNPTFSSLGSTSMELRFPGHTVHVAGGRVVGHYAE